MARLYLRCRLIGACAVLLYPICLYLIFLLFLCRFLFFFFLFLSLYLLLLLLLFSSLRILFFS
jgi:hypothetical protein